MYTQRERERERTSPGARPDIERFVLCADVAGNLVGEEQKAWKTSTVLLLLLLLLVLVLVQINQKRYDNLPH